MTLKKQSKTLTFSRDNRTKTVSLHTKRTRHTRVERRWKQVNMQASFSTHKKAPPLRVSPLQQATRTKNVFFVRKPTKMVLFSNFATTKERHQCSLQTPNLIQKGLKTTSTETWNSRLWFEQRSTWLWSALTIRLPRKQQEPTVPLWACVQF